VLQGELHPGDHIVVDEGKDGNLRFTKGKVPQGAVR
jgi:hypothetical protein